MRLGERERQKIIERGNVCGSVEKEGPFYGEANYWLFSTSSPFGYYFFALWLL